MALFVVRRVERGRGVNWQRCRAGYGGECSGEVGLGVKFDDEVGKIDEGGTWVGEW